MPDYNQLHYMKRAFKDAGLRCNARRDKYTKGCRIAFIGRDWRFQVWESTRHDEGPDTWGWCCPPGRAFEVMYEACDRLRSNALLLSEGDYAAHPETLGMRRKRLAAQKTRAKQNRKKKREPPLPVIFKWINEQLDARGIRYEVQRPRVDDEGILAAVYLVGNPPTRIAVQVTGYVRAPRMMRRIVRAAMAGDAAYQRRLKRDAAARRRRRRDRKRLS